MCQIYGKHYLSTGQQDPLIKERVLERIPEALSTVLEFSYLVQKFYEHRRSKPSIPPQNPARAYSQLTRSIKLDPFGISLLAEVSSYRTRYRDPRLSVKR